MVKHTTNTTWSIMGGFTLPMLVQNSSQSTEEPDLNHQQSEAPESHPSAGTGRTGPARRGHLLAAPGGRSLCKGINVSGIGPRFCPSAGSGRSHAVLRCPGHGNCASSAFKRLSTMLAWVSDCSLLLPQVEDAGHHTVCFFYSSWVECADSNCRHSRAHRRCPADTAGWHWTRG